jgi:hypothetical protein
LRSQSAIFNQQSAIVLMASWPGVKWWFVPPAWVCKKEYGVVAGCEAVVCTAGMGLQKRIWRRGRV